MRLERDAALPLSADLFVSPTVPLFSVPDVSWGKTTSKSDPLASLITVCAELLHRYTQQAQVMLSVSVQRSVDPDPSAIAVMLDVADNPRFTDGVAQVQTQLSAPQSQEGHSPVALLHVARTADGWQGTLTPGEAQLPADAARLTAHYARLLRAFQRQPEQHLSEATLLDPTSDDPSERAEWQQVVEAWNATALDYPRDSSIGARFIAQAQATPDAVAVVCENMHLSYGALLARASQLAHHLRAQGIGPEVTVGICLERSPHLIPVLMGIILAGGAYVPLDPTAPAARQAQLAQDAGVALIVMQAQFTATLAAVPVQLLGVETLWERSAALPTTPPPQSSTGQNLAYICYTSGSTGMPKGVAVPHRGVLRLVLGATYATFGPGEIFFQFAPLAFDAATLEIWGPLLTGGRLVVAPAGLIPLDVLGATLVREAVTTLWLTAGLFHLMVEEHLSSLRHVRHLLAGGDVLRPDAVQRVLAAYPDHLLTNGYGPTETTTFATTYAMRGTTVIENAVPIGRPITNSTVYVLDAHLRPQPVGVPGDLYLGGDGLARGYVGRPDLTAERFLPHPFVPSERVYWSGDMAQWQPDGTLAFLGRRDGQVKLRGFRIEVGEIERALLAQAGVQDAVVLVRATTGGEKHLVAYIVGEGVAEATLLQHLREVLPAYMVPSAIVLLAALPLNRNGKVDRRALPDPPAWNRGEHPVSSPPQTPTEERIADLFAGVLHAALVGREDNFFTLGGNSLLATQLIARLRVSFGLDLTLETLFDAPTVAQLATQIEQAGEQQSTAPALVAAGHTGPLPLSYAQERMWFLDQLQPDNPLYVVPIAVRLQQALDVPTLQHALQMVVARQASLRTTFTLAADGPIQQITSEVTIPLRLVDLRHLAEAEREAAAQRETEMEATTPFQMDGGQLTRLAVVQFDEHTTLLLISQHHIISDGWSMAVFIQELLASYDALLAGLTPNVPPLPVQYVDYALWQRHWLDEGVMEAQLAFWNEHLRDAPVLLNLPIDRPRPPIPSYQGMRQRFDIPPMITQRLQSLSQEAGATLYMTLLTAFELLLHRATQQTDFLVGTVVAGRQRPELDHLIGFFVNTLPLRVDLSGEPTVREALNRARTVALGAFAHQDVPFERIVEAMQPTRNLSYHPLIQAVFVLQNTALGTLDAPDGSLRVVESDNGAVQFDLMLEMTETGGGLQGDLLYATDIFEPATIAGMVDEFTRLLGAMVAAPDQTIAQVLSGHSVSAPSGNREGLVSQRIATAAAIPTAEYVAPRTPLEAQMAPIWADVLHLDRVGVFDDFFAIGGHSLLAMRLVARLRAALGRDISLHLLFLAPTIAGLAALIAEEETHLVSLPSITAVPRGQPLFLSPGQEGLWFIEQLTPNSALYLVPFALRLPFAVDHGVLVTTLQHIAARHESWRTAFISTAEGPRQVISAEITMPLRMVDLRHLDGAERDAALLREVQQEARTPFDLTQAPLVRVVALQDAPDQTVLLVTQHHIITDAWSLDLLADEFMTTYRAVQLGQTPTLPLPSLHYADFAAWQRTWAESAAAQRQLTTWQQRLDDVPTILELPTDYPRPSVQTYAGALHHFELSAALVARVQAMSNAHGVTPYMLLLAAFEVLLQRYSHQSRFVMGTVMSGRAQSETEPMFGFFVNTLPLPADLSDDPSFKTMLERTRRLMIAIQEEGEMPFDLLLDHLAVERDPSYSPLVQVMFTFQASIRETKAQALELDWGMEIAKYDLTLDIRANGASWDALFEYNTALFATDTVERMGKYFVRLLSGLLAAPEQPVSSHGLLSATETRRIMNEWNSWTVPVPNATLSQLVEQQVARTPAATALISPETTLTYAELNGRANQLAHALLDMGIKPTDIVGVCLHRTPDIVISILGILKTGAAYLPLDPTYPSERLSYSLSDAQSRFVITSSDLWGVVPDMGAQLIEIDEMRDQLAKLPTTDLALNVTPASLAYVIYTSGSTGRPKGVAIAHQSAVAMIAWAHAVYSPEELSGVLFCTSICFDISIYEMFAPLSMGGTVILAENALALTTLPARDRVTLLDTVPSAVSELVDAGGIPASVQTVNIAGEPLAKSLVERVYALPSVRRVYNMYGPTEDTTYSTWAFVPRDSPRAPSVGRPIANTQLYIVDEQLHPVPVGVPGEIYLGGAGLSLGYLGRSDMTAERYVPNPFSDQPGARMYRTGDLGRYRPDGEVECLGRIDQQVKVRGFRVELGEIENVLVRQPGVEDVSVVVRDDASGNKAIVAYVVADAATTTEALRDALRAYLPGYMIPSAFMRLDALPLTSSGKVNRLALPPPSWESDADYVAPRTPREVQMAALWADVLHLDRVGVSDNFFALGGHSLLATRLATRLRTEMSSEVPLIAIFEHPTVASLAAYVDAQPGSAPAPASAGHIQRVARGDQDLSALVDQIEQLSDAEIAALLGEIANE